MTHDGSDRAILLTPRLLAGLKSDKIADRDRLPADRTLLAKAVSGPEAVSARNVCASTALARNACPSRSSMYCSPEQSVPANCFQPCLERHHRIQGEAPVTSCIPAALAVPPSALDESCQSCAAPFGEADCCGGSKLKLCFRPTGVIPERSQASALARPRSCIVSSSQ